MPRNKDCEGITNSLHNSLLGTIQGTIFLYQPRAGKITAKTVISWNSGAIQVQTWIVIQPLLKLLSRCLQYKMASEWLRQDGSGLNHQFCQTSPLLPEANLQASLRKTLKDMWKGYQNQQNIYKKTFQSILLNYRVCAWGLWTERGDISHLLSLLYP